MVALLAASLWMCAATPKADVEEETFTGQNGVTWVVTTRTTESEATHMGPAVEYQVFRQERGKRTLVATFQGSSGGEPGERVEHTFGFELEKGADLVVSEHGERTISRDSHRRSKDKRTTDTTYRWDGKRFVAGVPREEWKSTLLEPDGTEWTIEHGPTKQRSPAHASSVHVVRRTAVGGNEQEVARLEDSSSIQSNPTMSSSSTWRFFLSDDKNGTFRAEQTVVETQETIDGGSNSKQTRYTLKWDGKALVR